MKKALREALFSLKDEAYRDFSKKLLPKDEVLIGVRLPALKKLSKELAKGDWQGFLSSYQTEFFEEDMLKAFVLCEAKTDLPTRLFYIERFLPSVKNWSVTDSFCAALKTVRQEPETVWEWLLKWLHSEREYEVRFGVVMMLDHYLNERYIDRVLQRLLDVSHPGYYAKMAVAWAFCSAMAKFPERTLSSFKEGKLDAFTFKKTVRKCIESRQVDARLKESLRAMEKEVS